MIMAAANDEDDDFVGGIRTHTVYVVVDNKFVTCQEVSKMFFLKMSIVQLYKEEIKF